MLAFCIFVSILLLIFAYISFVKRTLWVTCVNRSHLLVLQDLYLLITIDVFVCVFCRHTNKSSGVNIDSATGMLCICCVMLNCVRI